MRPVLIHILILCSALAAHAAVGADRFESLAGQAEKARAQEQFPEAIRLYREGTALRPSWFEGWWSLGTLLYDQDRFSEAASAFEHLLSSSRHRDAADAFLALCAYETGDYDKALAKFRSWASAGWAGAPEFRDVAVYHFALLLTREGRSVESLYLLDPLAKRFGATPELTEAMGLASLRMKYLPEDYPPEARERVWLAGKAAIYSSNPVEGTSRVGEYTNRLELRYGGEPQVHYFLGTLYSFEGLEADVEREYRAELKVSPGHAEALTALAAIELRRSNVDEAASLAGMAVAARPDSADAHRLLGRVFIARQQWQQAAVELEQAKRLNPANPLTRAHLAQVYGRLGRSQDAAAEIEAYSRLKAREDSMAPAESKLAQPVGEKSP
jgi:tetratricopeptide (TPR) repeat protein